MALIDEEKLQGNVIQILDILKKNRACCDNVASAMWMTSSVAGDVFVTISKKGGVLVYSQPGGAALTAAEYGDLSPQ